MSNGEKRLRAGGLHEPLRYSGINLETFPCSWLA